MESLTLEIAELRSLSRTLVREWGLLRGCAQDVSATQCHALIELEREEVLTAVELAKRLGLDKSTISRILNQFAAHGWIEEKIPGDRRRKPVSLSPIGRARLAEIHRDVDRQVGQALNLLHPAQRQGVLNGFRDYLKALQSARALTGTEIRPIREADDRDLATIIRAGMREFGLDRPGTGYDDPGLAGLTAVYSNDRSRFLVAERAGLLLGGAGIAPLKDGDRLTCELQRMYLSPAARGAGLGALLLGQCLVFAKSAGFERCYLETMGGMQRAQALYRSFGFRQLNQPQGTTGHCACNTWFLKHLKED